MNKPWFEADPARLQAELDALKAAHVEFTIDEELRARGKLHLSLKMQVDGVMYDLVADFPDFYPKFRPLVLSLQPFGRHYHPASGNLCLLGRGTRHWYPNDDNLAKLLLEQFPEIVRIDKDPHGEHARAVEQPQGEPFTDYYPYLPGSMVAVDDLELPADQESGWLLLGVERRHPLRAAVLEVWTRDKRAKLATANEHILKRYERSGRIWILWKRLTESLPIFNAQQFWQRFNATRRTMADLDAMGVVFPEEVQQGVYADGWVFIYQCQHGSGSGSRRARHPQHHFARAVRVGERSLRERIKSLGLLANKKIVLLGLGALGSPTAWEFARAGIAELRVVDFDFVDHGPTVRTSFGWSSLGFRKVDAASAIELEHPYTKIVPHQWHIGDPAADELQNMETMLKKADLVFDATAEEGIQDLFSAEAQKRGIPYVWVTATPGAWGGVVGRGCWHCYQWMVDGREIPWPVQEPVPDFQPVGCAEPTFSGTGFDMSTFALHGVRLAVSTLCSGAEGAYPAVGWDVAVVNMRDSAGKLIVPELRTFVLRRHENCRQHGE